MPDSYLLPLLLLGLLLGAKHALDADHIAAILTIATENRTFWRSSLIGFCWGVGHTAILLVVGAGVLFYKLSIPADWNNLFEAGVGVMLIVLGFSVGLALWRERLHVHAHEHENAETHRHLHSHRAGAHHHHLHRFRLEYRSLAIGMVHGLAGSAALLLLVVATMPSVWQGLLYILVFGIGSIAGMVLLATALSIPFAVRAERMVRAHQVLRAGAALISIVLGSNILFGWLMS